MTSYNATQWNSSADKRKFESQFKKFITSGYKLRDFPKWFYSRLCGMFGLIAHRCWHSAEGGFYEEYFLTPEDRRRFNQQVLEHQIVGDPALTYSDVEKVLQTWMRKLVEDYDELQ